MTTKPWSRFFQAVRQEQLSLNSEQHTRFSRAQARLRIAQRFNGISLRGVSSATERGYSAGMGIFLAYSGMEALATAMGQPAYKWEAEDKPLAKNLNKLLSGVDLSNPDRHEGINWLLGNQQLIDRLRAFQEGRNHNILLIAQSLRHMVAHGSFTTHGLKMFTKRECEAVEQLRQMIFQICDQRFTAWLDEQLSSTTVPNRITRP
jgi:hypothetical protein